MGLLDTATISFEGLRTYILENDLSVGFDPQDSLEQYYEKKNDKGENYGWMLENPKINVRNRERIQERCDKIRIFLETR
jgi:hypothetical protein